MNAAPSPIPLPLPEVDQKQAAALQALARLAQEEPAPEPFLEEFLRVVVDAGEATAAAIWTLDESRSSLGLVASHRFDTVDLAAGTPRAQVHERLIGQLLATGRGTLVAPGGTVAAVGESPLQNPLPLLLNVCPFASSGKVRGIVELLHPPPSNPMEMARHSRFLHQACRILEEHTQQCETRQHADRQRFLSRLDTFVRDVHRSLNPRAVAATVVNDGRLLIGCDRVSLAYREGSRVRILAVSGQDQVDRRANAVRALAELTALVLATGETLEYEGGELELAPRLEERLQACLEESGARVLQIIPLTESDETDSKSQKRQRTARPHAALIVEQLALANDTETVRERSRIVAAHSATALANAMRHHRIFLRPLFEWLGNGCAALRGRTLLKLLACVLLLGSVIGALLFTPGRLRLEGKGTLLPEVRRNIFAGEEGVVRNVLVSHGSRVEAGDPLLILENLDLAVRLQKVRAEAALVEGEYSIKAAQRGTRRLDPADEAERNGQLLTLRAKLESLQREIQLLEKRSEQLTVRAPLSGMILTWDVERRLLNRPVSRGNLLLHQADENSPWILEVRMPEDRIGHVLRARRASGSDKPLAVDFLLATRPEETWRGWVKQIGDRTELIDGESFVMLTCALDPAALPPLRPGAEVRARVDCGEHSLAYVWFHEVIEFVQSRILFLF